MQSGGLIILPEPQLSLTDRNQGDYEFGRVNSLDVAQVGHLFTLRNETDNPLVMTQLQPSCHCTTVSVQKIAGQEPALAADFIEVPPRQEIVLEVTVQLARQASGPLSQSVYIFVQNIAGPVARLTLTGELTNGVRVTPATLDFGRIKSGETLSRKITVTFDPRVATEANLPALQSHLDVEPGTETGTVFTVVPETAPAPEDPAKEVSAPRVKTYLVTVRPGRTGDLFARLFFAPLAASGYKGAVLYDTAAAAFSGIQVPVRGQVME